MIDVVIRVTRRLNLIDEQGKLVALDSLSVMEVVDGLELETGLSIPPEAVRADHFASIESIAALLESLPADGGP
jgi:acyl carrier protein